MKNVSIATIAVVGLGYVGLPLAVEFAKKYEVIGYDINESRISELISGRDRTREVDESELLAAKRLTFTSDPTGISAANIYIITTPTPVDEHKNPNLGPVLAASRAIGEQLSRGNIVIYESTVYPGATEEDCVPILEEASGLKYNEDFYVGYSPERINPGDKVHRLPSIMKVTSGSTPAAAQVIDDLYASIITAGTHLAPSIKVAEAAKVIENTQRDVNIALVNELAKLFNTLKIDTGDVLAAAGTKWNFLNFQPGLVGGHCIGVDPYYLTHKARAVGYHPEIILAGRRINDGMSEYIVSELVKQLAKKGRPIHGAKILILGLTFKENTPDLRNTRVVDIVEELRSFAMEVDVHDPYAEPAEAQRLYGIELSSRIEREAYDGVVLAVAHDAYLEAGSSQVRAAIKPGGIIVDLKRTIDRAMVDFRL